MTTDEEGFALAPTGAAARLLSACRFHFSANST